MQWYGTDEQIISYVDIDRAQSLLGIDNLKAYAESPEKVRELLKLVEQMDMENTTEEEAQTINTAEHRAGFQNASLHWYFPRIATKTVCRVAIRKQRQKPCTESFGGTL